jgi:Uma2 family endonuclease
MDAAAGSPLCPDFTQLALLTKQLPETDGVPLESPWHRSSIGLLERDDFFVGGNMFLYYSIRHLPNEDVKGPDFFYVSGVDRHRRRESWILWEEDGRYPDLIVEFPSRLKAVLDRTVKKEVYEKTYRTPEYFLFNPVSNRLEGWRLVCGVYEEIVADERGWMWSEILQLWLGAWTGEYAGENATWLRLYGRGGNLVPTGFEAATLEAEAATLRAQTAERSLPG